MRIVAHHSARNQGHTLLVVFMFVTVSFLVLAASLDWCLTNARMTDRNNQYLNTVAAAEAATEKVLASIARDYAAQGEALVWTSLGVYRNQVPNPVESAEWRRFTFSNFRGQEDATYVQRLSAAGAYAPLASKYKGLYGMAAIYRIASSARMLNTTPTLAVGVRQDIELSSIPVFQFAVFYNMDMEINPGPNMNITGRVHGNANINLQPQSTLRFLSDITAAGDIIQNKHTNDPLVRSLASSRIIFEAEHDSHVDPLNLPIGTNNTPDAVHAVVEVPPDGESPTSAIGRQRFYNKADLVVLVRDAGVTVGSGLVNNFATSVDPSEWASFLRTDTTFYNKREGKTVHATQLDVGKLKSWSATNTSLRPVIGNRDVRVVYLADLRTQSAGTQAGVRLVNGESLPDLGLTVATPNPLYVQGHFNATGSDVGKNETANTKPASLVGDSINILSTAWQDANSALGIGTRRAGDTTVNAALLSGIVPSSGSSYSGGVENFPRFLEDWGGRTLTYNGSMVVMFNSKTAIAPWGGPDVYSPPSRNWAFDLNFLEATRLPPGTPEVRGVNRAEWAVVRSDASF